MVQRLIWGREGFAILGREEVDFEMGTGSRGQISVVGWGEVPGTALLWL